LLRKNIMKKKYYIYLFLSLIILLALFLRLNPMLIERDFWYDEAFTGILMKSSWREMNQLIFNDVHPPLYYWLLRLWKSIFGVNQLGLRSFSLLWGMLLIPSIYWVGKKMFDFRVGLLAALFCAVSPFAIIYSEEARMYAFFSFLFLWMTWFFYQALKTKQRKYWIYWGILGGLSFYTHYLTLFFLPIFYLTALLFPFKFPFKIKEQFKKTANFWWGALIIIIFFVTWLKPFLHHIARRGLGWVKVTQLSQLPETFQFFFLGHLPGKILAPEPLGFKAFYWDKFHYTFGPFLGKNSWGLIIFSLIIMGVSYAWLKKRQKKEITFLAVLSLGILIFLILLSQMGIKLFVARYFFPIAVLIYILLAGIIFSLPGNNKILVFFLSFFALVLYLQKPMEYKSGWYQLLANQNKALTEAKTIIIDNPFDYASARYYLFNKQIRLYNQFNPKQDFSLWIIIDDENKIIDPQEIGKLDKVVAITDSAGKDNGCTWKGSGLTEIGKFGQLVFCKK